MCFNFDIDIDIKCKSQIYILLRISLDLASYIVLLCFIIAFQSKAALCLTEFSP